jgi:hypothetical protein
MVTEIPVGGGADVAVGVHGESTSGAGGTAGGYRGTTHLHGSFELAGSDGVLVLVIHLSAGHEQRHHPAGFAVPQVHLANAELDVIGWFQHTSLTDFATGGAIDGGKQPLALDGQGGNLSLLEHVPATAIIGDHLDHEDAIPGFPERTNDKPLRGSKIHQCSPPAVIG